MAREALNSEDLIRIVRNARFARRPHLDSLVTKITFDGYSCTERPRQFRENTGNSGNFCQRDGEFTKIRQRFPVGMEFLDVTRVNAWGDRPSGRLNFTRRLFQAWGAVNAPAILFQAVLLEPDGPQLLRPRGKLAALPFVFE
jgi:hypothetical protein